MAPSQVGILGARDSGGLGGAWEGPGQWGNWPHRKEGEGLRRAGLDLGWRGAPRPEEALLLPAWVYDRISFSNSPERSLPWNERPRR